MQAPLLQPRPAGLQKGRYLLAVVLLSLGGYEARPFLPFKHQWGLVSSCIDDFNSMYQFKDPYEIFCSFVVYIKVIAAQALMYWSSGVWAA